MSNDILKKLGLQVIQPTGNVVKDLGLRLITKEDLERKRLDNQSRYAPIPPVWNIPTGFQGCVESYKAAYPPKEAENLITNIAYQTQEVRNLGDRVGYGFVMQAAQYIWADKDAEAGHPGGNFIVGCCEVFTVPCGCESSCNWCQGSGWLTERVKLAKDQSGE
jgi:hypothetical protein